MAKIGGYATAGVAGPPYTAQDDTPTYIYTYDSILPIEKHTRWRCFRQKNDGSPSPGVSQIAHTPSYAACIHRAYSVTRVDTVVAPDPKQI